MLKLKVNYNKHPVYSEDKNIRYAVRYFNNWNELDSLVAYLEEFLKDYPDDTKIRRIYICAKTHFDKRENVKRAFDALSIIVYNLSVSSSEKCVKDVNLYSSNDDLYYASRYCYNWDELDSLVYYLKEFLKDYPDDKNIALIYKCIKYHLDERENVREALSELDKMYYETISF